MFGCVYRFPWGVLAAATEVLTAGKVLNMATCMVVAYCLIFGEGVGAGAAYFGVLLRSLDEVRQNLLRRVQILEEKYIV